MVPKNGPIFSLALSVTGGYRQEKSAICGNRPLPSLKCFPVSSSQFQDRRKAWVLLELPRMPCLDFLKPAQYLSGYYVSMLKFL